MLRALIVDDEPLARARLQQVLAKTDGLAIVATCADAEEARQAIAEHDPDMVFLDIEMPGESGLALARDVDAAGRPLIVFVTAHPTYALEAFDVAPVDYVLKPPEALRCRRAVSRAMRILAARSRTMPAASVRRQYLTRLFAKDGDRLVHIRVADIDFIEALGNYVKIHAGAQSRVLRGSLTTLESRLDPNVFVRTHRSYIVNLTRMRELVAVSHGDYRIVLDRGANVPLSRVYRDRIELFVLNAAEDAAAVPALVG